MHSIPFIPGLPVGGVGLGGSGNVIPVGVSVTESDLIKALGDFLKFILPTGFNIRLGQENRVAMPLAVDFLYITPGSRTSLSTSLHEPYNLTNGYLDISRAMSADMQIDVYGPASADNAQIIVSLFRDDYACEFFEPLGFAPLYCNDASQMPLINGEEQYEQRWTITATMQLRPTVSTPLQFADKVALTLVEADQ